MLSSVKFCTSATASVCECAHGRVHFLSTCNLPALMLLTIWMCRENVISYFVYIISCLPQVLLLPARKQSKQTNRTQRDGPSGLNLRCTQFFKQSLPLPSSHLPWAQWSSSGSQWFPWLPGCWAPCRLLSWDRGIVDSWWDLKVQEPTLWIMTPDFSPPSFFSISLAETHIKAYSP